MTRLILIIVVALSVLWLLLSTGIVPTPLAMLLWPVVGTASSLAIPALIITAYAAPGLLRSLVDDTNHFWHRLRTRGHDVDELKSKIVHLDRPYHMQQLGLIYAKQGRIKKAQPLFEQALTKDPDAIDAKYHLALCHFANKNYQAAADLLEQVHVKTPEYDYGVAYLRLAQSQQFLGNKARAKEIYQTMLRFYPGHPEATYHYGLLLADEAQFSDARKLMQEVIFTVRHSPGFSRRRNRHWALNARWWLWRHRAASP